MVRSSYIQISGLSLDSSSDPTTAPLLRAAAKCSAAIYKHSDPIPPDDYSYAALKYVEPTMLGTTKATAIYEAKTLNLGPERGGFVVVAVRGSASKIDHIVNLNNQAVDVGSFIVRRRNSINGNWS